MVSLASPGTASLLWPSRSLPVPILAEEVHVWAWSFAGASEVAPADLDILDDRERRRTARFHFARDQARYSVCHAKMRRILGSYLGKAPEALVFREAAGGKPELILADSEVQLCFNLSHSKTVALLAVALGAEVGVDVEDIRPIERAVAERFFSTAEIAAMADLDGEAWLDAFYRCWTRKEAILKVEGQGLRIPLDSFDVSVRGEAPAALLAARPEAKLTAHWHLHHLAAAEGTMGALAFQSASARIETFALVD